MVGLCIVLGILFLIVVWALSVVVRDHYKARAMLRHAIETSSAEDPVKGKAYCAYHQFCVSHKTEEALEVFKILEGRS